MIQGMVLIRAKVVRSPLHFQGCIVDGGLCTNTAPKNHRKTCIPGNSRCYDSDWAFGPRGGPKIQKNMQSAGNCSNW